MLVWGSEEENETAVIPLRTASKQIGLLVLGVAVWGGVTWLLLTVRGWLGL